MSDRDRYGLRRPVKLCELHRTWYSRGCKPERCETEERSDVSIVEFRRDGFVERCRYKNPSPNSSEWTNLYDYNDADQLTVVRIEQGGTTRIQQSFEYDSAGRMSHVIVHENDGEQRIAVTYSYEPDGRKMKVMHIDPKLSSGECGTMFGVDGTDVSCAAPGATSITSVYDEGGRPIEHLFHDSDGNLVTRVDLRYDERGNLVEEVASQQQLPPEMIALISPEQMEAFRMLFAFRRHHRYDDQNRRIETSSNMAPKDFERETFTYNEHGDVILKISESSHCEYDFGQDGGLTPKPDSARSHRSEARFRYQYDSLGNWIEKIIENPGGPIWSIERRTISYF